MSDRPKKHPRAPSAVSRDAKRFRDDETVLSEMSMDTVQPLSTSRRRKRDDQRDGDATLSEEETTESVTETAGGDSSLGETVEDDEAWLKRHSAPQTDKGKGKVARTSNIDSPSQNKRRVRRGARDPFITSPPGSKARGKRRVDESDDHQIGEEWTDLNGLRWRMGDDGEVRREAVVMEMRLKYPNMPKDSRHPDAKIKVPVLVEKFLTEDEYEVMRSKKLLGFQEEERRRVTEEVETKKLEKRLEEERQRRKALAESGERPITTPRKVRNIQALYESPVRKSASPSPLRSVLPSSGMPRSRAASDASFKAPVASVSPSVPYKRLSLSMGSSTSAPTTPVSTAKGDTDADHTQNTPERSSKSLRIPLSSPCHSNWSATPATSIKRMLGSLGGMVARRKREESILSLLRTESEQRKKRESVR